MKRLLALFALAAASLAAAQDAPTSAEAIKVEGTATPGALLFVSVPNGTVGLKVDGVPLAPAPDGRFLVGLPRDTGDKLVLEAVGASGRLAIREVATVARPVASGAGDDRYADRRMAGAPRTGGVETPRGKAGGGA